MATRLKAPCARLVLILLAASTDLQADTQAISFGAPLRVSGTVSTGVSSSDRLLTDRSDVTFARGALKVSQTLKPGLIWRIDADVSSKRAHGGDPAAVLREAYVSYRNGPLAVKAGLQNIFWGRADVINPTDNLTPRRYTWLSMTDAEQRIGSPSLQTSYQFDFGRVSAVALPAFRPSVVPLGDTGGFSVREHRPNGPQGDVALKFERQEDELEWSVSWFNGHSSRPNIVPAADITTSSTLTLRYPKVSVIGADFAVPWRGMVLRGESAYTRANNCCELAGADFRKRDNLFTVLGAERAIGDGWRLVAQAFHKQNFEKAHNSTAAPPMLVGLARASDLLNEEIRPAYTGISLGLYSNALGEQLKGSLDAAWVAQTQDYVLRPRISYYFRDNFSFNIAADIYGGDNQGPFGRLRDNTLVMTSLQWGIN